MKRFHKLTLKDNFGTFGGTVAKQETDDEFILFTLDGREKNVRIKPSNIAPNGKVNVRIGDYTMTGFAR